MSTAATKSSPVRWFSRKVKRGVVVIDDRAYRPVCDDVHYAGQLDGHRAIFGRHVQCNGKPSRVATLWGVWDPIAGEYRPDVGPHVVAGRYPFAVWSAVEELP